MAEAAWSWVEKMLHEHQRTVAPSAVSVSIRTAVWMVMCSEPVMSAPLSGCLAPNSERHDIRPGISTSARLISSRPKSASAMSRTLYSRPAAFLSTERAVAMLVSDAGLAGPPSSLLTFSTPKFTEVRSQTLWNSSMDSPLEPLPKFPLPLLAVPGSPAGPAVAPHAPQKGNRGE